MHFIKDESPVMSSSQQVDLRVGSQDPESVLLAPEGLHTHPLGQVPHPDALVLAVAHDQVLDMEHSYPSKTVLYDDHKGPNAHRAHRNSERMPEG